MTRCPFLPFLEYENVTDEHLQCFTVEVVTFTQDFGPYKKGDKADSLSFDFISGTCIEFCLTDREHYGKEVKRFNIRCSYLTLLRCPDCKYDIYIDPKDYNGDKSLDHITCPGCNANRSKIFYLHIDKYFTWVKDVPNN